MRREEGLGKAEEEKRQPTTRSFSRRTVITHHRRIVSEREEIREHSVEVETPSSSLPARVW